jgi:hypothetical protein
MPMPRFRFTVRRMMVAVAIVAVAGFALAVGLRRSSFRTLEDFHRRAKADAVSSIRGRKGRALADYHDGLRWKYARAARYPWLPVAPDPSEPE